MEPESIRSFSVASLPAHGAWGFPSIIVIETIILVPSYFRQESVLLISLEKQAQIAASLAHHGTADQVNGDRAVSFAQRILSHPEIKGVLILFLEGATLAGAGEVISGAAVNGNVSSVSV